MPNGQRHIVALDVDIVMEDMDGTPEQSAEVLLFSTVIGELQQLLLDKGYDSTVEVTQAWVEEDN